jgi:hypothetical protein
MNEFNEIDHRVREKIGALPEVAPPDFVRDAVMSAIRKEPKRFAFYWWGGALVGVMALVYLVYLTQTNSSQEKAPEQQIEATSNAMATSTNETNAAHEAVTGDQSTAEVQLSSVSSNTETGASQTQQTTNQASKQTAFASARTTTQTATPTNTEISRKGTQQKAKQIAVLSSNSINGNQNIANLTQIVAEKSQNALVLTSRSSETLSDLATEGTGTNAQLVQIGLLNTLPFRFGSCSSLLLKQQAEAFAAQGVENKSNYTTIKSRTPVEVYKPAQKRRYIEVYGGTRYAQTILASPRIEDNEYLALRKQTERADLGWEAGLRTHFMLKNQFSLQVGAQLSQNTSVFQYDDIQVQVNPVSVGAVDSTYMTGVVRYERVFHRMHTLDVPVTFGYQLKWKGNDLRLGAGAEINLGVRSYRGGMMFNPAGERITFSAEEAKTMFKTNIGGRMLAQAQLSRQVRGLGRVFAETALAYQPFSATKTDYPLTQKYVIGSFRLGYAFAF